MRGHHFSDLFAVHLGLTGDFFTVMRERAAHFGNSSLQDASVHLLSGGEQTKWGVSALNVMTEREKVEEGKRPEEGRGWGRSGRRYKGREW